jgi:hypothetical protein
MPDVPLKKIDTLSILWLELALVIKNEVLFDAGT